jgi:hypothetical protein
MTSTRPALKLIIGGAQRTYTVSCTHCGERLLTADRIGELEVSTLLRHLRRVHDRFLFGAPLLGELLRHVQVITRPITPPDRRSRLAPAAGAPPHHTSGSNIRS